LCTLEYSYRIVSVACPYRPFSSNHFVQDIDQSAEKCHDEVPNFNNMLIDKKGYIEQCKDYSLSNN